MKKYIINAKDIKHKYVTFDDEGNVSNEVTALEGLNININYGEFVVLLGHNGSGKSTFAKHINGILKAEEGVLIVDGIEMTDENSIWQVRENVGMVFQNPDNQIVATIVEEDVAFGVENLGLPSKEIRQRVDDALKTVGMTDYARISPNQLSGGQKQRIAIAGIIAMQPKCIVFDESTAMLDPIGRREVIESMKMLNRNYNITIIHITHYMQEAIEADRIIVMDKGKIVIDGTPKQVFKDVEAMKNIGLDVPDATYLAYLLKQNGINIRTDIINTEEVIEAICQLK